MTSMFSLIEDYTKLKEKELSLEEKTSQLASLAETLIIVFPVDLRKEFYGKSFFKDFDEMKKSLKDKTNLGYSFVLENNSIKILKGSLVESQSVLKTPEEIVAFFDDDYSEQEKIILEIFFCHSKNFLIANSAIAISVY